MLDQADLVALGCFHKGSKFPYFHFRNGDERDGKSFVLFSSELSPRIATVHKGYS